MCFFKCVFLTSAILIFFGVDFIIDVPLLIFIEVIVKSFMDMSRIERLDATISMLNFRDHIRAPGL